MQAIDAIAAGVFFGGTMGALLVRVVHARKQFRLQQRTAALLVEGVRLLERDAGRLPVEREPKR
jgi:hypothetical protein